jgi:hypothetical protein
MAENAHGYCVIVVAARAFHIVSEKPNPVRVPLV